MIRIGYAAINTGLPTCASTFRLGNYTEKRMLETARHNLEALLKVLTWNRDHKIFLFRITSSLVPFGSHPVNSGIWKEILHSCFVDIGLFIKLNDMRVSMHPGQYTVLNTQNQRVLLNSMRDLDYHCTIMEEMGLNENHPVILHGGGVYKNKSESINLLIQRINRLPSGIKKRLVLENDEWRFSAEEIYFICKQTSIPAVLDIFHHQCNQSFETESIREIILKFKETWPVSYRQKIHYSNQQIGKKPGAHAAHLDIKKFSIFYEQINDLELDIMLETKDKQNSVLRIREIIPSLG